ncbi:cell division protein FtsK [Streptococcus canis]|uniref:FtsK/SpoIIIE domain-containing protein n=1 Tax=Streptococcus canis TaxID=1329 RepID=UPI00294A9474|nr:FtsK/SpoIIIE domain-containing protein [Streptococcus canis]MDV5987556.1 cell division protein FtsK [Streptococcus canis]
MKLFTYRGLRIRKFYENIKGIIFFVLMLPFLTANGLYHYFHYLEAKDNPIIYGVVSFLALLLPAILCFIFETYLFQRTVFFGRLDNLRVASTFLRENNFVYSKKVNGREVIKFPKVFLKRDKFGLDVTFVLQGNKFQDRFLNLANTLETMYDGDFMLKTFSKGYVTYTIILDHIRGRISVHDIVYDDNLGLRLMEDIWWNFKAEPHLLIGGGTGGGKTVTMMSIIKGLVSVGYVDICDPKKSDFVGLKDVPVFRGRVYFDKEDMIACLKENVENMNKRYLYMTSRPDSQAGKNFSDYDLKPHFILFDEWASFIAELEGDYAAERDVLKAVTQIVLKGRQAGFFLILGMQRPDGEYIKTALRDNFMKRISVGHLEDNGYRMMFGEANRTKVFKKIDEINGKKVFGRGYVANNGEIAQEFFSPEVPFYDGYSFLDEFKKLEPLEEDVSLLDGASSSAIKEVSENDVVVDGDVKTIDMLAKEIDKSTSQIRKLILAIEEKNFYSFNKVDGKYSFEPEDELIIVNLFNKKDSFDGTWDNLLSLYFEGE